MAALEASTAAKMAIHSAGPGELDSSPVIGAGAMSGEGVGLAADEAEAVTVGEALAAVEVGALAGTRVSALDV